MRTVHVRVEGQVQGVFFRDYTEKHAITLGLNGWVQNMDDGAVEAVICGKDEDITSMITLLHAGSPHSNVTKVTVNDFLSFDNFSSFKIIS